VKKAPYQWNRRSFLVKSAACIPALIAGPMILARSRTSPAPIILGDGRHRYEWIPGWAKLPEGMIFGNTHGAVVIDGEGRVYMNTDTENAVMVFDPEGKFIKAWGKEWKGGSHGMALHREGRTEYIYLTHHSRHEFAKFTLDGELVWAKGYPTQPNVYTKADEFRPTGVAIAPNGDIYVTDGYGKSWVHHYNSKAEYIRSWGGPGTEQGKLKQPHGIWLDRREKTPRVLVADRENHRLQWFSLAGEPLSMLDRGLRRPSNFDERGKDIAIADLEGRVTIIDGENKIVTHLGDNEDPAKRGKNPIPRDQWVDGQFISPHCPRWDAQGNLYVLEWLSTGRITKLKRLK
jgi:DNA-binding beta-propeller fold protein YncE